MAAIIGSQANQAISHVVAIVMRGILYRYAPEHDDVKIISTVKMIRLQYQQRLNMSTIYTA
ncbi:hypothetical protein LMG33818_001259 [Halomonadaceae bacterium LMG 33818]